MPACPGDFHVGLLAGPVHCDADLLDQVPDQLLAVGAGGGGSIPDRGQVGGQGPDLLAFGSCQRPGAGGGEAVVLLAQPLPLGQRGLPVLFQLPDDQPVLRLGELVLAAGPVSGEIGAFQPLPPDLVDPRALGFRLPGRSQRDLEGARRDRLQQQAGDVGVDTAAGQLLALAGSVIGLVPVARVDRLQLPAPAALVVHRHLAAAPAAGDQPGQQGRAVAHCAQALGTGPVGLQSPHVPLVLLDADIGGQQPGQEHQPVIPPDPDPASEWPPRLAPPGIQCAAAVGVNASVGRVAQNVRDGDPAGAAPGQLAALGSLPQPHPQLDMVVGQRRKHCAHGAQLLEQLEDQADHAAHLLVGIQHHLARRAAGEPGRQRHRQLAAAGLGDPPRPHPLLDQVQLGLLCVLLRYADHVRESAADLAGSDSRSA